MTPDIKRILVPLDFSNSSRRTLDYACGIAEKFDAALHMVHVCETPSLITGSMDAYAVTFGDWTQRLGEDAERELNKLALPLRDLTVTTEVLFGNAPGAIVEAASNHEADLIVMGTHGHGPLLHVLMGNVAERVVRTAPCPVLTVREPRGNERRHGKVAQLAAVGVMFAALLLTPIAAAAQDTPLKQSTTGGEVFRMYCGSCHGSGARGDGPLASSMKRKPANLTEIAKRNGGVFPPDLVFRTIDGRQPVGGHGGPDMPVWGDAFSRSRESRDGDDVKRLIQSLVDYLETVQVRPANEQ